MSHVLIKDIDPREITGRWQATDYATIERRESGKTRFLIESEGYKPALVQRIHECYRNFAARDQVAKYASLTLNVQRRVTDAVASPIYRRPPRRFLEDGTDTQNEALAAALAEGQIASKAKQWGRFAFIGNVVFVIPTVIDVGTEKRLRFESVLPWNAEVFWTEGGAVDPDFPSILVWKCKQTVRSGIEFDGPTNPKEVVYKACDARGLWGLNARGVVIQELGVWDHGVPPFVPFRVAEPPPWDWWDRSRGSRLPEVTLEAGRIQASMHWIRKEQQRKLLVFTGEPEDLPTGTAALPETSVNLFDPAARLTAVDYETKPDSFITEIRFLIEQAIEAYGLPSSAVDLVAPDLEQASSRLGSAVMRSTLSEIRDDQAQVLERYERDLAWKAALQMKSAGHPLASALPPDAVRAGFRVVWQPLSQVDTRDQLLGTFQTEIEMGLKTRAQALMELHPTVYATEAAAQVQVDRNIDQRNIDSMKLAIHNVPANPVKANANAEEAIAGEPDEGKEFETIAQTFGRQGGRENQRRAGARREE